MGCNTSKDALAPVLNENGEVDTRKAPSSGKTADETEGQEDLTGGVLISLREETNSLGRLSEVLIAEIDLDDPEAEKAATKIQAAFRGHKTRKSVQESKKELPDRPPEVTLSDVEDMKPEDAEIKKIEEDFDPNDKELCEAATKIQASFRGHMSRKAVTTKDKDGEANAGEELSEDMQKLSAKEADELADIDLTDPDLHKAATKIQASFRGHRARKDGPEDAAE